MCVQCCCRVMDRPTQKETSTDPCGPKVQPGPCVLVRASPASRLGVRDPHRIGSSDVLRKPGARTSTQAEQTKLTPAALTSISRPRPTALGTKAASKLPRVPAEYSKEIDLIPVCIPGPQSANALSHSTSEPSFPLSCSQSPQLYPNPTPNIPLSSPNLTPSLSPKPGLSPEPQRISSPGSTKVQPERPGGENSDFR